MPAGSASAERSSLELAPRRKRPSADRILRLDAALRDMAETCPLPMGFEAMAARLDVGGARADR